MPIAVPDRNESSMTNSPTRFPAKEDRVAESSNAGDLLCATIILDQPPSPWTLADWHLKEIAGVPFIMRNILNLQKEGVKRLIIYHKQADDAGLTGLAGLAQIYGDPRIHLEIDLISDPNKIVDAWKNGKNRLFLSGSALHQRAEIARALDSGYSSFSPGEWVYPISEENLENLKNFNQLETSEFKRVILSHPFLDNTETGVFLAGSEKARISKESDFRVQSERLFQTCGLSNDSFMDRLVTRSVSRQLTRFFVRTNLTPNQITGLGLVLGLVAAGMFFHGNYFAGVAGAVILLFSAWIDCTDGEVARLKFQESKFGSSFDIFSDNVVHCAVFFSIGMGLYFSTGNDFYRTLGLLAALGSAVSFALSYSQVVHGKSQASEGKAEAVGGSDETESGTIDLVAHLANRDFIYLIFLLAVAGKLGIFIFVAGIGVNVFAAFLVYTKLKPYLMHDESLTSKNSEKR